MSRISGGHGSVIGVGWLGWAGKCCGHGQEVSDGVRRKLRTKDDSSRASR